MNEEQPSGSPWIKNLAIWGSIALVLALLITVFNPRGDAAATQVGYSDLRAKVAADQVGSVQVGETKILGKYKDGKPFTSVPIPNDTSLQALLQEHNVQYEGKAPEESSLLVVLLIQVLPVILFLGLAVFVLRQMQKGGGAGGAMGFPAPRPP